MKFFFAALLLMFSPFAQADMSTQDFRLAFHQGTLVADCSWIQGPLIMDESLLKVEWKNGRDGSAVEPPGPFAVSLFMPSMSHGSAPTQLQRFLDGSGAPLPGVYRVSNLYFMMKGDWQIRFELKSPDHSKEIQTFQLHLPE